MKITLSSESDNEKVYEVKMDGASSVEAVESHSDVQQMTNGKEYHIEGDMEDPAVFWMTVTG